MADIKDIQNEIIDEFSLFSEWMEKYEYIIDLGKSLPMIDPKAKVDNNLIKGCQSQVWLQAERTENGKVHFTADSDAIITKGIIALLIRVLDRQTPETIAHAELFFIEAIGLREHLSPTRSNGLVSMVKQMKLYGIAFQAQTGWKKHL